MNVFIIGSKGIPANYGGFETFVDNLTERKKSKKINYHVACFTEEKKEDTHYNNARCFYVKVPNIGSAKAILYDLYSLKKSINFIEENNLNNTIIYILTCRIGPFIKLYRKKIKRLNIKVYVNPDGHEWKRSKWNYWVKKYWKLSERLTIKNSDFVICDSKNIEKYIKEEYGKYTPKTTFVPYGAEVIPSNIDDHNSELKEFYDKYDITPNNYFLIVGRFVPENNIELIIKEYMKTNTKKSLVIITNVSNNRFYQELLSRTSFKQDNRIKFVGTVYNQQLLKKIRENAFAYLHGHEVGGTNPSLLEALASTKLNLLLDVPFNTEVGKDAAIYFNKDNNNLSELINRIDKMSEEVRNKYSLRAKNRIIRDYDWNVITSNYEKIFEKALVEGIKK